MSRGRFGLSVILCLLACASVLGVRAETQALDPHQALVAASLDPSVLAQEAQRYLVWVGIALAGLLLVRLIARRLGRADEAQGSSPTIKSAAEIIDALLPPIDEADSSSSSDAQSPAKTLNDLKNEIIDRRKGGQPGLLTEWITSQTKYPTPDHVPVEYVVDMIYQLYGGFWGIRMLFLEGLMEYLTIDAVHAFGKRAERIIEVLTQRVVDDARVLLDDDE